MTHEYSQIDEQGLYGDKNLEPCIKRTSDVNITDPD
jgi:hypothetical protein